MAKGINMDLNDEYDDEFATDDVRCPNCGEAGLERHDHAASCIKCGWEKMEFFSDDDEEGF